MMVDRNNIVNKGNKNSSSSYYVVTLVFLLISAKASVLFFEDIFWFLLMFYILIKKGNEIIKNKSSVNYFFGLAVSFIVLSLLQYFLNTPSLEFFFSNLLFLFKYILLTYLVACYLKEKYLSYLIKVMRHLAIIGLCMYALQLINFDIVYSTGTYITSLYSKANPDPGTKNLLFFNLSAYHNIRNSGFAWEPGAYGCFLVVTLFLSLIRNKFKFQKDQILFLISILTTLSTTAYLGVLVVLISYFRARKVKKITMLFYFLPVILIGLNLSFLSDKIQLQIFNDMDMIDNLSQRNDFYSQEGLKMPLNRFASMIFIISQFGYKLIWGMGNKYESYYMNEFAVNLSNGDFDFIARFGLIGLFFYLKRSFNFFKTYINSETAFYAILILLILGYAENILLLPFFFVFVFLKDTFLGKIKKIVSHGSVPKTLYLQHSGQIQIDKM